MAVQLCGKDTVDFFGPWQNQRPEMIGSGQGLKIIHGLTTHHVRRKMGLGNFRDLHRGGPSPSKS